MFASVPTLIPQDALSPWYPAGSSYSTQSPSQAPNPSSQNARSMSTRGQSSPPTRTSLSVLRAEENAIEARKAKVRRFGATWLKPPGVSKTLQGMWDEKAEREEQEAAQAREQALADAQAAAAAEAEAQMPTAFDQDLDEDALGARPDLARDLDADIPEADDANWIDDEDEDAMPTEEGDGDYAEEAATTDIAGEIDEHDLDEDVPEAGSYQHTDTDLEEESSDGVSDEEMSEGPGRDAVSGNVDASIWGASSVFGNSPVGQNMGPRRSGGFGRGREN